MDKRGGGRFNRQHNELLTAWIHVLLGTNEQAATVRVSAFEQGSDIENPSFEIASRTAYARRIAV